MPEELSRETLEALLEALPTDLNFVDETDTIRYRRAGRVFRSKPEVIGQKVQDCHSAASVPMVNRIISDFKSGRKKEAEFWKDLKGRKIYIRYFPVKDKAGKYIGTLEVMEDITDIRKITGEKTELD